MFTQNSPVQQLNNLAWHQREASSFGLNEGLSEIRGHIWVFADLDLGLSSLRVSLPGPLRHLCTFDDERGKLRVWGEAEDRPQ